MENNVYAGLFGLGAFGLLLNIEWLFLTFILLGVALLILDKTSEPASPFLPGSTTPLDPTQYQQPVVVQNTTQSLSHDYYMNLINNQVNAAVNETKGGH